MPTDPWMVALLRFGALALVATAFALVLRLARCPGGRVGAALLGGGIAGILMGPGVAGAVWPREYDLLATGPRAIELDRDIADRAARLDADLVALGATGVSSAASDETRQQGHDEISELQSQRAEAIDTHLLPVRVVMIGVVCVAIALAIGMSSPVRPANSSALFELLPSLIAGMAGAGLGLLATAVIVLQVGGLTRPEAVATGSAVAAGTIFARFGLREGAGSMGPHAMSMFGGGALMVASMGLWWSLPDDQASWLIAPVLIYLVASIVRGKRPVSIRAQRRAGLVVLIACVAPLTALLVSMVDPIRVVASGRTIALVVLMILAPGGALWLGAWLALKARGTQRQRGLAGVLALDGYARGVVPTRVLMLGALVAAGGLDPAWATDGAILLGALVGGILDALTLDSARGLMVQAPGARD